MRVLWGRQGRFARGRACRVVGVVGGSESGLVVFSQRDLWITLCFSWLCAFWAWTTPLTSAPLTPRSCAAAACARLASHRGPADRRPHSARAAHASRVDRGRATTAQYLAELRGCDRTALDLFVELVKAVAGHPGRPKMQVRILRGLAAPRTKISARTPTSL
jgi:hypothetical protein